MGTVSSTYMGDRVRTGDRMIVGGGCEATVTE